METVALGIYRKNGTFLVNDSLKNALFHDADKHPRSRSRVLIHSTHDDNPQEMIIAFNSSSIVEVSTHIFSESFTMLDGLAKYIFYNEDTSIASEVILSPYDNLGCFYCFISSNTFHRFIPYSPYSLAYEVGFSSFRPDFTSLYLEPPFDKISSLSNEECALLPYSGLPSDLVITSCTEKSIRTVSLSSQIVYLNHDIIEKHSDLDKPTLFKISGIDQVVKDYVLILPPKACFNFLEHSFTVFTVCMLSSASSVQYSSDTESLTLTSENHAVSTASPIQNISNSSSTKAVLRFTISK